MIDLNVLRPMEGCRLIRWEERSILFGQPPEVVKSLMRAGVFQLDTLVLPDVRERHGALLNNLEFPLYFFLFFSKGLEQGRRLKLVGDSQAIADAMELLRLTLLGPTREELLEMNVPEQRISDFVNQQAFFSIKDESGKPRQVPTFFELIPFQSDVATDGSWTITRTAPDVFDIKVENSHATVNLNDCNRILPPYTIVPDFTPNELVKLGVEVLGGASGFSMEEASTGLVLCFNGSFMLIDSIPFIDHHLHARGIAANQVTSMFLTHIHDDHCSMFPLMRLPHRIDVLSTPEIFEMAMRKLSLQLGLDIEEIKSHFHFVPVNEHESKLYYGLSVDTHYTVHSIPTIGATFSTTHLGRPYRLCVVGDNQSFGEISEMRSQGLLRPETEITLRRLYVEPFDLLIADGGMGSIHGNPEDALQSQAERVVFVHVDELPERFNATFSMASSGKRYILVKGESDFYITRAIEFLLRIFGKYLDTRWISTLLADKRIVSYNRDDVIFKQGEESRGIVYLMLTGFCDVVRHDGEHFQRVAQVEAGELIGEMAAVSGEGIRNASVVARTPVTVCEFSEETMASFIGAAQLKDPLTTQWTKRKLFQSVYPFNELGSQVVDRVSSSATMLTLNPGESHQWQQPTWAVLVSGAMKAGDQTLQPGDFVGNLVPHEDTSGYSQIEASETATVVAFPEAALTPLLKSIPRLNYFLLRRTL